MEIIKKTKTGRFFPAVYSEAIETAVYHYAQKWASFSSLSLMIYWGYQAWKDDEINAHYVVYGCLFFALISSSYAYFLFTRKFWKDQPGLSFSQRTRWGEIGQVVRFSIVLVTANGIAIVLAPGMLANSYSNLKAVVFVVYAAFLNGGVSALALANIFMSFYILRKRQLSMKEMK